MHLPLLLFLLFPLAQDPARDIRSKEVGARLAAVETLRREGGEKAAELLEKALKDKDWEVVEEAAAALGERGDPDSVDSLIDLALGSPVRRIRRVAAAAAARLDAQEAAKQLAKKLGGRGALRAGEALEEVGRALADGLDRGKLRKMHKAEEAPLRVAAARAAVAGAGLEAPSVLRELCGTGDVEVAAGVLEACLPGARFELAGPAWEVLTRERAPGVLVRRARDVVVAALLQAGPHPNVEEAVMAFRGGVDDEAQAAELARLAGALALGRPGAPRVAPATLIELLSPALGAAGDPGARAAAVDALRRIGGEESATRLRVLAAEDGSADVRALALRWVCEGGPLVAEEDASSEEAEAAAERARWTAERLTQDGSSLVREEAAVQLGRRGLSSALAALIGALEDPTWEVALCAAVSLGEVGDPAGVEALARQLAHQDWRRRGAAAVGLGLIPDRSVVPHLISLLADGEGLVARSAWEGLARLSGLRDLPLEQKAWEEWWSGRTERWNPRDERALEERRRRFGYSVPDAEIYRGLDVIVLESRGDHIQNLLGELEIAHRMTSATRIPEDGLHPAAVFFANCTGEIEEQDAERLAWFVRSGGYLFSSCWALSQTVERIAPGVLRKLETRGEVLDNVTARPCAPDSPYLTDVFPGGIEPIYHLEGAHLIEVVDPERAEVLIDSPSCAQRHGGGGALAAWFRVGHGVILDSVNHFDLQGLEVATWLKSAEDRQAHAIDHMGVDYATIRETRKEKYWGNALKASREVHDLSAFRFVTNFVRAKRIGDG